jgi:uncharacterized membrane protein YbaN (DUF454 family)
MPLLPSTSRGARERDAEAGSSGWRTWAWRALGTTLAAVGFVGLAIPILPTVPFLILAAMAFAHGDSAARRKLLAHPKVGPPLKAWFDHGLVSRKAKVFAIVSMTIGAGIGIWVADMSMPLACVVGVTMAGVAVWLAFRPEHPPKR